MNILIKDISSLVTVDSYGQGFKVGSQMKELGVIRNGAILFNEKILWVGTTDEAEQKLNLGYFKPERVISAKNKTIIPGFVDSHTHVVFAGDRSDEFARRLRGVTYEEIAREGGGILTTMRATRKANIDELVETGRNLILSAMRYGTTAIEIKSGYGLDLPSEIKMLEAIKILKKEFDIPIVATFLGAHDFPPEYKYDRKKYVDIIINEMIPTVTENSLAEFCDVFIDKGYYTLDEGERILSKALEYGLKLKVHCDELADVGAASLVASLGAVSADHLLFVSDKGIDDLKQAGTVASLLPGTAFFIRMPYANARKIIDNDNIVALATDCNPGSCFCENMQFTLWLSAINMRMTAEECIAAVTINGAKAIELSNEIGSLEVGKQANFIIADCPDYTYIFYHFGINQISEVWVKGKLAVKN